jgi:hypothetical protein
MTTKIDEARLRGMSVHDRHQLWINARKIDSDDARKLIQMIEGIGLPYSDPGSLKTDDPIFLKMYEIINSQKAISAAIEATKAGLPALTPMDPMLVEKLGVDYGSHNDATINAGYLVAEMMRSQGYRTSGRKGKLPATSVAKTAEIYVPAKK